MDKDSETYRPPQEQPQQESSISIADELTKLAKLKERGVISEDEFYHQWHLHHQWHLWVNLLNIKNFCIATKLLFSRFEEANHIIKKTMIAGT
jgi:hypothetical protein